MALCFACKRSFATVRLASRRRMALCRRTAALIRMRLLFCSACLLAFLPERLRGCAAAAFPATASTDSGSVVFGSRSGEGVRAPSPLDTDEDAGASLLNISEEVDETAVELAKVLPVEVLVKGEHEGVDEFITPCAGSAKLVRFGIALGEKALQRPAARTFASLYQNGSRKTVFPRPAQTRRESKQFCNNCMHHYPMICMKEKKQGFKIGSFPGHF